jgi:hypothetical protein
MWIFPIMEKPTSHPYFELLYILLLYYDVNVVEVFPLTKSDVFVGRWCNRTCLGNRTRLWVLHIYIYIKLSNTTLYISVNRSFPHNQFDSKIIWFYIIMVFFIRVISLMMDKTVPSLEKEKDNEYEYNFLISCYNIKFF